MSSIVATIEAPKVEINPEQLRSILINACTKKGTFTRPSYGKAFEIIEDHFGFPAKSLNNGAKQMVVNVVKGFNDMQLNPGYQLTKSKFSTKYDEKRSVGISVQSIQGEKVLSVHDSLILAQQVLAKVNEAIDELDELHPDYKADLAKLETRQRHLNADIESFQSAINALKSSTASIANQ